MDKNMIFGKFLKECIDKRNFSVSKLAKDSGINRGKLYLVFDGKRKLTEEELFTVIEHVGITGSDAKKLIDLFFCKKFGNTEFMRIKYLENTLCHDICTIAPVDLPETDYVSGALDNRESLINAITYIFKNDNDIITDFSFLDKRIDETVYSCITGKYQNKLAVHIMLLSNEDFQTNNLETVFRSFKYLYNNIFPVYRYVDIEKLKYMNRFPYRFVGRKYAILYNDENGIFIDNPDAVRVLYGEAKKDANSCTKFGDRNDDVMFTKSIYTKMAKTTNHLTCEISYFPCLGGFADYDFMYNIAKKELPDRETLAKIAYKYYSDIFSSSRFFIITSCAGIKRFAETGHVQEIPPLLVNTAEKPDRIRLLKELIVAAKNDRLYLANDELFALSPGFSISIQSNGLVFCGNDYKNDRFFEAEKFIACIDNQNMVKSLHSLCEYLIGAEKVHSKEFAVRFIEELLIKLEL